MTRKLSSAHFQNFEMEATLGLSWDQIGNTVKHCLLLPLETFSCCQSPFPSMCVGPSFGQFNPLGDEQSDSSSRFFLPEALRTFRTQINNSHGGRAHSTLPDSTFFPFQRLLPFTFITLLFSAGIVVVRLLFSGKKRCSSHGGRGSCVYRFSSSPLSKCKLRPICHKMCCAFIV